MALKANPITITGIVSEQSVVSDQSVHPFADVVVHDAFDQSDGVEISFAGGGGVLSDFDEHFKSYEGNDGVQHYFFYGTAAQVTATLESVVFTPSTDGKIVFAIEVSDNDFTTTATTTVVVDAPATTDQATSNDDLLTAISGGDTILGLAGDDSITAGTGHDLLYGNAGNDSIVLLSYTDASTVYGGQGDDLIDARRSSFANFLSGDLGNDTLLAGEGNDTLYGGAGDDRLVGGPGFDQIYGNAGNDHIVLGAFSIFESSGGSATVYGGQGDDTIDASASSGGNYISGDLGNDVIVAGSGGDTIHGGLGSDTIQAASGAATYIHVGVADSDATSAADASQLDHVTGFNSQTKLVFDGDPAATDANTVFHGGDTAITDYAAAYLYAYGDATHAAAITGATAFAIVSDTAGHVYVFAQDHAAVEIDGLANGVSDVAVGQILAA